MASVEWAERPFPKGLASRRSRRQELRKQRIALKRSGKAVCGVHGETRYRIRPCKFKIFYFFSLVHIFKMQ